MSTTNYGAESLGCILDGALGQAYNDTRLIAMAREHGYDTTWLQDGSDRVVNDVLTAGPSWDDLTQDDQEAHEWLSDAAEEALDYLNSNAVDEGYSFEWRDGDLFLSEVRGTGYACVEISGEDEDESFTTADLTSVRIALPGEDGSGIPTQFDWLNSVSVDFDVRDDSEELNIYVSTGDPRGSIRVATLVRTADGSVTLRGATDDSVRSHEHYAKQSSDGYGGPMWSIR